MQRRSFAASMAVLACCPLPSMAARALDLARARDDFQVLVREARQRGGRAQIEYVNVTINRLVEHRPDPPGVDDWATPCETLARGAGDCEDFAIAKYFVLAESGCPCGCVRLLYARHHPADRAAASGAHMVALAHTPFDDPWVLDSIDPLLVPLSKRDDLEPVFSFDHTSVWVGASEQGWHAGSDRIRPWAMLLARDRQQH